MLLMLRAVLLEPLLVRAKCARVRKVIGVWAVLVVLSHWAASSLNLMLALPECQEKLLVQVVITQDLQGKPATQQIHWFGSQ